MSDNNSNQTGTIIAAFAIGAAVGAGIALLYAPRSGKETRELLANKGVELKNKATHALDEAKGFIADKKAEIAAAVEAGKEAMREERAKHQKA